jgi:hypothetical protein
MSFQTMRSREDRERERLPHPIWRGIGFAMIVLIPVISFVISDELIQYWQNNVPGFSLPPNLRQSLVIPIYGEIDNFWGVLILTAILTLAIFAIFSFINAMVYRATREKNIRVFESSPQRYKPKKKLRKPKDRYRKKDDLF